MKKILALLLIGFGMNAQTLPFKQIQKGTANGQIPITTGTSNVMSYTATLPASAIPTLSSYVPYTGATGSVNLGANSLSVGVIKSASVAVASPSNGWQWYDNTLDAFRFYHDDATGNTYNFTMSNSLRDLHFYAPATANPVYGWSFVTDDASNAGIGFQPNGIFRFGINSTSVVCTPAMRIGSSTAPTHSLTVTGNASISSSLVVSGISNSSTMTAGGGGTVVTGSAGTVAVLSDAVSSLGWSYINFNISDAATYYFGNMNYPPQSFAATMGTVELQYNCTLVGWSFNYYLGGTTGTGETATLYIRANNTTDTQLSNAITFNSASANGFSASGLSNNFTAGDRINMKLVCPTYATNPTQAYFGITLFFVRRL